MIKRSSSGNGRKIIWCLLICLTIEIFICNANSFRLWGKRDYEEKKYTLRTGLELKGAELSNEILTCDTDDGELTLLLKNINTCVGTIYIDLYSPQHEILPYKLYYTDDATAYPIRNIEREYIDEVNRTKWITCHFAGISKELRIQFPTLQMGEQLVVRQIIINKPVPFHINILRLLILFVIASLFFVLPNTSFWMQPYEKRIHTAVLTALTISFLIIMWSFYLYAQEEVHMAETEGDLYSQQLVDALLEGKTSLSFQPSEEFKNLENPYDITERAVAEMGRDIDYVWDAAYYNGHFYVYFGVVPAILLFAPFKLATGYYLSTAFAVALFASIYLIFLNAITVTCIKKWLPQTPFPVYPCSILLMDAASGTLLFVSSARFYELVYTAGLAFATAGIYLLLSDNWRKKENYFYIFFGGLFLALTVGCRPPMLFYSFLLIPHFFERYKTRSFRQNRLPFLTLAAPYIGVAIGLMLYNYIRFDTILEFGQNYQITVTDIGKGSYFLSSLPWCMWRGMFQPLSVSAKFPFIQSGSPDIDFVGYILNAELVLPMFSCIPLLYCIFLPSFWKKWKDNNTYYLTAILSTVIGLGWLIASVVFISAGVSGRYTSEAIPLLTFGAILLYCNNIVHTESVSARQHLLYIMMTATIFSFAVAFLFGIVGEYDWIKTRNPVFYYTIERTCCFWK